MAPCASRLSGSRLNGEPGRSLSSPRCGPARHRGERSGNERRLGQFAPALHDRRIGQARFHPAPSPARPYSSAGQFPARRPERIWRPEQPRSGNSGRASSRPTWGQTAPLGPRLPGGGLDRLRSSQGASPELLMLVAVNSVRKFIPPLWANSIVSRKSGRRGRRANDDVEVLEQRAPLLLQLLAREIGRSQSLWLSSAPRMSSAKRL